MLLLCGIEKAIMGFLPTCCCVAPDRSKLVVFCSPVFLRRVDLPYESHIVGSLQLSGRPLEALDKRVFKQSSEDARFS